MFECAVVGVKDDAGLEGVRAFVVLKQGYSESLELIAGIKGFLKTKIASYKVPQTVEFVPELPKTSTGRIRRFILRGGATSETLSPPIMVEEKRVKSRPSRVAKEVMPVTIEYAHLKQICRYQVRDACFREAQSPHQCEPSLCPLVRR